MKIGPAGPLHAMTRPRAAALLKAAMIRRMPIARRHDCRARSLRRGSPLIQNRNDLITPRHWERPAWAKVVLHIDHDHRVGRPEILLPFMRQRHSMNLIHYSPLTYSPLTKTAPVACRRVGPSLDCAAAHRTASG